MFATRRNTIWLVRTRHIEETSKDKIDNDVNEQECQSDWGIWCVESPKDVTIEKRGGPVDIVIDFGGVATIVNDVHVVFVKPIQYAVSLMNGRGGKGGGEWYPDSADKLFNNNHYSHIFLLGQNSVLFVMMTIKRLESLQCIRLHRQGHHNIQGTKLALACTNGVKISSHGGGVVVVVLIFWNRG